jgi:hypothetical protein
MLTPREPKLNSRIGETPEEMPREITLPLNVILTEKANYFKIWFDKFSPDLYPLKIKDGCFLPCGGKKLPKTLKIFRHELIFIVLCRRVGFGKFGKPERTKKVFEMDRRPSSFPSKVLQGVGLLGSRRFGSFYRLTLLQHQSLFLQQLPYHETLLYRLEDLQAQPCGLCGVSLSTPDPGGHLGQISVHQFRGSVCDPKV